MARWSATAITTAALTLLLALTAAAAVGSPAAAHLRTHSNEFRQMLAAVSVDEGALNAASGILLAPSDAAVEAFAASMGMTLGLLRNKLLVDQITAYHLMPKVKVTKGLKVPSMPLITKTAEPHFVVRFFKDPRTNRAWLLDMQGNKVSLKQQPVVFGNLTIVPVDKVLMSGGYFRSFEDALKLHGQLSKASQLLSNAGGLAGTAANATLFVPVDKAFDSSKVTVSSLNQADSRRVVQYHATATAKPADKLQTGSEATLLPGHVVKVNAGTSGEVKAPWSGKPVSKPAISVTDETGSRANVTLYNIWAGQGVIHGINKVLQPRTAAVSSAKAPAQAAKSGSRRHLLQVLQDTLLSRQHRATAAAQRSRKLLQSGQVGPDWSQNNPATALLAQNTVAAAYAAGERYQNAYYALPDAPGWSPMNQWSDWETNA